MRAYRQLYLAMTAFCFSVLPSLAAPPVSTTDPLAPSSPLYGLIWAENGPTRIVVNSVEKGSPFDKLGLARGDVIVGYGDQTVVRGADLHKALMTLKAGDKLPLKVLRDTKTFDVVFFGAPPTIVEVPAVVKTEEAVVAWPGLFGATVELDKRDRLVITSVAPNSGAARAGLAAGDLIVGVDDAVPRTVTEVMKLKAASAGRLGDRMTLRVIRGDKEAVVEVSTGTAPAVVTTAIATPHSTVVLLTPSEIDELRDQLKVLQSEVDAINKTIDLMNRTINKKSR